jgi:hypothetical protein
MTQSSPFLRYTQKAYYDFIYCFLRLFYFNLKTPQMHAEVCVFEHVLKVGNGLKFTIPAKEAFFPSHWSILLRIPSYG